MAIYGVTYSVRIMAKKYIALMALLALLGGGMFYVVLGFNHETTTFNKDRTGITGSVKLGPTCPIEQVDQSSDMACGRQPYKTRLVITTNDQAQIIKEFASDDEGNFTIEVAPGDYAIRSAAATNLKPYCSSGTIKVVQGSLTSATIYCDTGIR
jgi:hypothetical protein